MELVNTVATLGTLVVIAATAIAALIQLRHMRGSNQIVALTECRETLESPAFREAQRFVSYELPTRIEDPKEVLRIAQPQSQFQDEYQAIDTVGNFFESLGVFVKNGIIDKTLACDTWSHVVLRNWNALLPIITFVRKDLDAPGIWENFEYLAVLAQRFSHDHPTGTYPKGFPRMPEERSFIEAVEKAKASERPVASSTDGT
ncbi:MAG TPA: DUF4760 domain-containing protein [Candidatus Baltobacteraceae bacterium]